MEGSGRAVEVVERLEERHHAEGAAVVHGLAALHGEHLGAIRGMGVMD